VQVFGIGVVTVFVMVSVHSGFGVWGLGFRILDYG